METELITLEKRYILEEGIVLLTGTQALVRLPLDQHRADKRRGLNTATLISGYRGSPLGTYDITLQKNERLLKEHDVKFIPGVNEDLAATAIFGSQLAHSFPDPSYDGVLGIWYGKGPGVDRTGDIFKHANIAGVGPLGGVLAIAGDDPVAKSSTIPSHSEVALYDARIPVLYPGNVQEILDFGRLGLELSRYCGCWAGLKFVTNVADEFSQVRVSADRIKIVTPEIKKNGQIWKHQQNPVLLAPQSLAQEKEIIKERLEAAKIFARANSLNQISGAAERSKFGIITAGKSYYDLKEALNNLGYNESVLIKKGIRILKLGLIYPLDPVILSQFTQGLDEVLIIEEKRPFIELFVKDILYSHPDRPKISGKKDQHGGDLVREDFELDADQLTEVLTRWNPQLFSTPKETKTTFCFPDTPSLPNRTAYFCSGCPHNCSTKPLENSIVGGGIGCHTLSILMNRNIRGLTQMGGEGAQWVGISPFTGTPHIFQNIGNGTLFHSGTLAIRQAISAGVNITYKILYNSAVAMTGGQFADGEIPVPDLTRLLEAEGVQSTIVLTPNPKQYATTSKWANNVDIYHRNELQRAQKELQKVKGVSILIYDQECAAELRRKRKKGLIEVPKENLFINNYICEDCGDCVDHSNCLSLFPQETKFGRKVQVHQSSCNFDYSCLKGDCPSWLSVISNKNTDHSTQLRQKLNQLQKFELPPPRQKVPDDCNIYTMGVGGTGIVTINQILATAAFLEGKRFKSFDQTGLSQKGGSVVSHLKIYRSGEEPTNKIGIGKADSYLAFDLVTALRHENLCRIHAKSIAIISYSRVPTGSMIRNRDELIPAREEVEAIFESICGSGENHYFDAYELSDHFLGNHLFANMISIGVAYQAGALPMGAESIEQAIKINGVSIEENLAAFRLGRHTHANSEKVLALSKSCNSKEADIPLPDEIEKQISLISVQDSFKNSLRIYVAELMKYQNREYALLYLQRVQDFKSAIPAIAEDGSILSTISESLFKLMRVKDEYEIARLHWQHSRQLLHKQFGKPRQYFYHLHPPILRKFGLKNKLKLGKWMELSFYVLQNLKFLRGSRWDLFGYSELRKMEKRLVNDYQTLLREHLKNLSPEQGAWYAELAGLPSIIRGFGEVRLRSITRYHLALKDQLKKNPRLNS